MEARPLLVKKPLAERVFPYAMMAPSLILFTVFAIYPFLKGFYISFYSWDGLSDMKYNGWNNYMNIMRDGSFWNAVKNTFHYAFLVTVGKNVLGFALAKLMISLVFAKGFFRTVTYMPVTFSYVVCGILWTWIFNPTFGLLNQFLTVIGASSLIQGWLSDPKIALYSVMWVDIWKWAGFHMVLYLAGLQAIPRDYYEAAQIDGAGPVTQFFKITVPQLNSVIVLNVLMAVTGALVSNYDVVNVMTGGGPVNSTEVALTYITKTAFRFYDLGKASAMSVILFFMTIVFSVIQIVSMTKDENYDG